MVKNMIKQTNGRKMQFINKPVCSFIIDQASCVTIKAWRVQPSVGIEAFGEGTVAGVCV